MSPDYSSTTVTFAMGMNEMPCQKTPPFRRPQNILLGKNLIRRTKETFFESGGDFLSAFVIAIKCQGTR
jgi:hypothetical protein